MTDGFPTLPPELDRPEVPESERDAWYRRAWNYMTTPQVLLANKIWAGFEKVYWALFEHTLEKLDKWTRKFLTPIWDLHYDYFKRYGWLDDESEKALLEIKTFPFPVNIIAPFIAVMSMWLVHIKTFMYVVGSDIRRKLNSDYSPEDAPPQAIIPAAFIAPEKTTEIRQILMNQGFSEDQIDLMFISMYRTYDENVLKVLYWRKVLTEEEVYIQMKNLGYTENRIDNIMKTWPVIPGIMDILTMVAREAFEEDIVREIGLDAESEYLPFETLEKLGLSKDWVIKYWRMHWMQPSIQQGFEMLHRYDPATESEKIITPEILDMLFRIVEIPPYWREKLTKIAYMPFTRVDVRRMHKMGELSGEELIRAYEEVGFDRAHAEKMASFTIKFNQGGDKDLTKAEILKGYKEGLILIEDARELLIDMGYNEDEAGYLITYEDYKRDKDLQDIMLKNLQSRFEGNLLSESATIERLNTLNLSGSHINLLMEKWKINIYEDMKVPSKADLVKMFAFEIITQDRYRQEMGKLGYNEEYIGWYLQLNFAIEASKK